MRSEQVATLTGLMQRASTTETWRQRAACRGLDVALFFPLSERSAEPKQVQQAKAVCAGCPVRSECLAWALTTGQQYGIFGGLTSAERGMRRRSHLQLAR